MNFTWEHRTILHTDTGFPGEEYLTIHEFQIENGEYKGYSPEPASPMSKEELEWMRIAFDKKPVIHVDDASCRMNEEGILEYGNWKWLEKTPEKSNPDSLNNKKETQRKLK